MTFIGWMQILLYCAIVVALVRPLGGYMTRVFNGERTFISPLLQPGRDGPLCPRRRRRQTRAALAHLYGGHAAVQSGRLPAALRAPAPAGRVAAQSGWPVGCAGRPRLQHRRQLRHQHQLAELRRRKHDVLPHADARADACRTSSLQRPASCWQSRSFAASRGPRPTPSAISGSMSRAARSTCCCPSASSMRSSSSGRAFRRRWAPTWTQPRSKEPGRPSPWPCRLADRHQDARHQRRRLLQRQRRASLREPHGAVELRADDLDLRHRRGAHQRVRPHGRQRAPGLGRSGCHGRAVHRRRDGRLLGRRLQATMPSPPWG